MAPKKTPSPWVRHLSAREAWQLAVTGDILDLVPADGGTVTLTVDPALTVNCPTSSEVGLTVHVDPVQYPTVTVTETG